MSLVIPTVKQLITQNLAIIEGELNQDTPILKKAFNRVMAVVLAMLHKPLYNFGSQRAKENLAITATRAGLIVLRDNYGLVPKPAESNISEIELPALTGTVIPAGIDFIGTPNGVRYFSNSNNTSVGGIVTIEVTAEVTGVIGNLLVGDELTIGTQVAGAESTATVTEIINTGIEDEGTEALRVRVLNRIRTEGGGGNSTDFKGWSLEVGGVDNAYPYSGRPVTDALDSVPLQRTVYVLASTSIDPDGIPPQNILDDVRASIITDPITGKHRQPLGLTNDTLFVEPIRRTGFFTQINGLDVPPDILANVQVDIEAALSNYYVSIQPYIEGLDSVLDRNDLITDLTVSEVVQDVLSVNGGSATGVSFGLVLGQALASYRLNQGELSKSFGVNYV